MKLSMHLSTSFVFVLFATFFQGGLSESQTSQNLSGSIPVNNNFGSAVFRVLGNVYPDGRFITTLNIGEPPKPYDLDIDTGSELTWIQCDAPCVSCLKSPHQPYKPKNNVVSCKTPLCNFVPHPSQYNCHKPSDQCDYEIAYADHGSSLGVLVNDNFPLRLVDGSTALPSLAFGCGYEQHIPGISQLSVDGVLGLANGKPSILSQLRELGITKNVFGHCYNSQGGGYFFFGDKLVPSQTAWVPMAKNLNMKYYTIGPAELLFGGQSTVKGGFSYVLDSGSTYTYFSSQVYGAAISMIKKNIDPKQLKDAPDDKTLPICWRGAHPFKSIIEVKKLFKPLALHFPNAKNVILEMPPEAYLIISKNGNVCLGILDGKEAGLGNLNVLGDISLLDKMFIYDNEQSRIGWISRSCKQLPKF